MQPVELALFVVVSALALALIGYVAWPYVRRRRQATRAPQATAPEGASLTPARVAFLVCPACQREFEPTLRFCPHDARELVAADDRAVRAPVPGVSCPTCKRSFDSARKYCSFDGDELVPLPVPLGAQTGVAAAAAAAAMLGALGKICPTCSRRYEGEATFCGRDGAELVTVN
jgi:hypothetical protein